MNENGWENSSKKPGVNGADICVFTCSPSEKGLQGMCEYGLSEHWCQIGQSSLEKSMKMGRSDEEPEIIMPPVTAVAAAEITLTAFLSFVCFDFMLKRINNVHKLQRVQHETQFKSRNR